MYGSSGKCMVLVEKYWVLVDNVWFKLKIFGSSWKCMVLV